MKTIFTLIFVACCSVICFAQKYKRVNGKIKVDDETFCLYKEIPIENLNHGSRDTSFKDVAFYTLDSLPVIYMEARALSTFSYGEAGGKEMDNLKESVFDIGKSTSLNNLSNRTQKNSLGLINYYQIDFPTIPQQLNIRFFKETFFYFVKDMIWYNVFLNGKLNPKGLNKLIEKWKNKEMDFIDPVMIEKGLSMSYKTNLMWTKTEVLFDDVKIDYENKNIYRRDELIGNYVVKQFPYRYYNGVASTYIDHYLILNKDGTMIANVSSGEDNGFAECLLKPEEENILFSNVDKSEQAQLYTAVYILLRRNKFGL